jgi:predicted transcriptional regulator
MNLTLPDRQQADLASLATRTGRPAQELLAEAVDRLVEQEKRFAVQVQVGLDQFARGEFLEEEEMDARFARMLQG